MVLTESEHIEDIIRHKELVKNSAILLAKRLIKKNKKNAKLARELIIRGYSHDNSKLVDELEWCTLHTGNESNPLLDSGIKHHQLINRHHPEFHGGLENMDQLSIAEMCCDWLSRSSEFGTSLKTWVETDAVKKYDINIKSKQYKWILEFVDLLTQDYFVRAKTA